jgi:uncharacterized small protein (DUF1192 family)
MTTAVEQPTLPFATTSKRQPNEEEKMPAIDSEDDRPKKKITHEIGQDLALLSVGELSERINLLKDEIGRLEAEISRKRASQNAANAIFKK